MNKISLIYSIDNSGERQDTLEPQILVDEVLIQDTNTIDIFELVESCHKEGEFFILTCGCGVPECAGIYDGIRVKHKSDVIIWEVPNQSEQNLRKNAKYKIVYDEFVFSKPDYISVVSEGLRQIKRFLWQNKKLDIDPVIASREDVLKLNV